MLNINQRNNILIKTHYKMVGTQNMNSENILVIENLKRKENISPNLWLYVGGDIGIALCINITIYSCYHQGYFCKGVHCWSGLVL